MSKFTYSLYSQWLLHYFKATAVSNSFKWKFHFLIQLSCVFVGLISTLSRSWKYHYFLLSLIFRGANWCVSWFDKNFISGFFIVTVKATFFKLFTKSYQIWWPWPFLNSQLCRNHKLQIIFYILVHLNINNVWFIHTLKRSGMVCFHDWCVFRRHN